MSNRQTAPAEDIHTLPENTSREPEVASQLKSIDRAPIAGFLLTAAAVGYIAFRGGGYGSDVREGFGLALWWLVLLVLVTGGTRVSRPGRGTILTFSLLVALAGWTLISIAWSSSAERSHTEALRVVVLLGGFVGARHLVARIGSKPVALGALAAISGIALLAIASRALPDLFPPDPAADFLPDTQNRLSYPIGYWNGLGALVALGFPLALHFGASAADRLTRALSSAALPILGLAVFLTLSRGAVLAVITGVATVCALSRPRAPISALAVMAIASTGALIWATESRSAFADAIPSDALDRQGIEMLGLLALAVLVMAVAGSSWPAKAGRWLGERNWPQPRRSVVVGVVAVAVALLAVPTAGRVSSAADEFLNGDVGRADQGAARLTSVGGNSRPQYWSAAIDAWKSEPLVGIGAGTWEFWWAENGDEGAAFARDAHSLFLESLGELGPLGLTLMITLVGVPIAAGFGAARKRGGLIAAATAGCLAFAVSASLDWTWEVTAVPFVFFILAAIALSTPGKEIAKSDRSSGRVVMASAVVASLLLVASVVSTGYLSESQSQAAERDFDPAVEAAEDARVTEPFSASAWLQQALVLEAGGDLHEAAGAAHEAIDREPSNWRLWLILGRIEAERGHRERSEIAYLEAYSLNSRSPIVRAALTGAGISVTPFER